MARCLASTVIASISCSLRSARLTALTRPRMVDQGSDKSQKTEEPTQKKLDDFRKKGEIANSREVSRYFMILAATIIGDAAAEVGYIMIIPTILFIVAALGASVVQGGLVVAVERIKPKLYRASPLAGIKRLFSFESVAEFIKGILTITIVGAVATMLVLPYFKGLEQLVKMEMIGAAAVLHSLVSRLLIGVLAVVTVIAVIDFLYQRFEHMK